MTLTVVNPSPPTISVSANSPSIHPCLHVGEAVAHSLMGDPDADGPLSAVPHPLKVGVGDTQHLCHLLGRVQRGERVYGHGADLLRFQKRHVLVSREPAFDTSILPLLTSIRL